MPLVSARRQRGLTLVEALIAFLVLAFGLLAIARIQTHLRLNAELARQRSEAVRLAQEDIESLRTFAVLAAAPGTSSFESISSESRSVDASNGFAASTPYRVTRQVGAAPGLGAKQLHVSVGWLDRAGAAQQIVLASMIAGNAPVHSGALGLARGASPAKALFGRSARIPLAAKDLGDGRSVFKPAAEGTFALLFDNASGLVIGRCATIASTMQTADLTGSSLGACDAKPGHLLSGVVRFSSSAPPGVAHGNDAPPAFTVVITLSGGGYPHPPLCSVEPVTTASGDRFAAYHCVVYAASGGAWSGRANLVPGGWTLGTSATDKRVCRYTSDLDASGAIDANIEHPASYVGVEASLANQNFLVVNGSVACPGGEPARVAGNNGDVTVDLSTAQHQP